MIVRIKRLNDIIVHASHLLIDRNNSKGTSINVACQLAVAATVGICGKVINQEARDQNQRTKQCPV